MAKKRNILIFIILFSLYIGFFLLCLPTFLQSKMLGYHYEVLFEVWRELDNMIHNNNITNNIYWKVLYKVPEWVMLTAVVINGVNMFFGFNQFKKKWWYYVILLINIILSVIIVDCWYIRYTLP